ncbi:hypothetical protein ACFXPI_07380 [Streptomyces sp. NPDC059104]|uniref:hypothetical protein n=1 Tax=Streptomyces sp. NPDC059104 TaxID=3346729 RepID=UPI0036BD4470
MSNLTQTHTGHAFGTEGYKTIAYEIHADLGVPAPVFVPTDAYAIDCAAGSHRAVRAVLDSGGAAVPVTDAELGRARDRLASQGIWAEPSAAAGLVGLDRWTAGGAGFDGPVVCVSTSSGFKDLRVGTASPEPVEPTWEAVSRALAGRARPRG